MTRKDNNAIDKAHQLQALYNIGFTGSFRTLRALENKAHYAAERYCNDENFTGEQMDALHAEVTDKVKRLFGGTLPAGFFVNNDPRGYALKIDNDNTKIPWGMVRDFGGYGILAPDFS